MLNEKLCIMCTRLNDKAKIFEDEWGLLARVR